MKTKAEESRASGAGLRIVRSAQQVPPDHLVPVGWLTNIGVQPEEIESWVKTGAALVTVAHGGVSFVSFPSHKRPIKFKEVPGLVKVARAKTGSK